MGLAREICETARELILERATKGGDGFRQWVYPHLPKRYDVNPMVDSYIEQLMLQGKSAQGIADEAVSTWG